MKITKKKCFCSLKRIEIWNLIMKSAKILVSILMVYNFAFGLFGTKSGSIFLGLNVSCETSVRCHVWLLSLCHCDFAVCIKTCEFSRDEIKSYPDTMSLSFFLSFSEILDLCTRSVHVACLWLFAFFIWEGDMWQRILQGTRRKEKRALIDVCEKTRKLAIMSTANSLWDQIGGIFSWSGIFTAREGAKNRLQSTPSSLSLSVPSS